MDYYVWSVIIERVTNKSRQSLQATIEAAFANGQGRVAESVLALQDEAGSKQSKQKKVI